MFCCSLNFLFYLPLFLKTVLKEQCQIPLLVLKKYFSIFKNKKLCFSYDAKQAFSLLSYSKNIDPVI